MIRFSLFIGLCLLFSCHSNKTTDGTTGKGMQQLTEADIYDYLKPKEVAKNATESDKRESKKHFLQAMDLYRNKHKADSAIPYFKKALMLYPDAKTYYELGNALAEVKNYEEAVQAYSASTSFQYTPACNAYYNMACAQAQKGNTSEALMSLRDALDIGYANKKQMMEDPDLKNIRNMQEFNSMLVEHFKDMDVKTALFQSYARSFKNFGLPFIITKDSAGKYNFSQSISYDFFMFVPGMKDTRYSREVTKEYIAVGRLDTTQKYFTLAYAVVETVADTLNPVETRIATYDSAGKEIDDMQFSCYCSPQEIKEGTMDANRVITVNQYERKWKFNPLDKGYIDNEILSDKMVLTRKYSINSEGKFVEGDGTATAKTE
ncbi:MAG: hypothetical protein JWO06_2307 [Bacteroidota bacterium]|nr:hypothetical protein [Bacteroidota bacterium]